MSDAEIAIPKLKGIQKAAIFLIALGPADSAGILKRLPEEEADRIAQSGGGAWSRWRLHK